MNNYDYVVLIDENGQPYIAHSLWGKVSSGAKQAYGSAKTGVGRGVRTAHKYLLKVGEGAKAQYAYTKEEVDRLMGRGRQKVQQTAEKAKDTFNAAKTKTSELVTKVPEHLKSTVAIRDKTSGVILKGQDAVKKIESGAQKIADKAKDVAGIDERERAEQAWAAVDRNGTRENWDAAMKAQSDYRKTPLGALDYAKERAWEISTGQDGTAKEIAEDLARRARDKAKETTEKAKQKASEIRDKAEDRILDAKDKASDIAADVKDKVSNTVTDAKDAVSNAPDKIRDKAKDIAGVDEFERYERAWDRTSEAKEKLAENPNSAHAQREVDDAEAAEAKAHEDYLKTPLGRFNDAQSRVKEVAEQAKNTVNNIKDTAAQAVETAKDKAGFDERQRLTEAINEYNDADSSERAELMSDVTKYAAEYLNTPLGKMEKGANKVAYTAKEIAKAAGVAAVAVPAIALALPLSAAVIVTKVAQIKLGELVDRYRYTTHIKE